MEGTLAEGVLPGLLREVYLGRRTGLLHVTQGAERASVCFIGGHIVWGDTTVPECHLGETLVRHGRLKQEDLARATGRVTVMRKRLGEVLVELGILDANGLEDALALHVREVLLCVFGWSEGSYRFEEREASAFRGYDHALRLSTAEVILDAVWSVQDPDVLRYALGDIDRPMILSTDPLLRFQKVTLTPTDGFLLSRLDGVATAREVMAMAPVSPEEALRSLFGLLSIGMVEPLPPRPAAASGPASGALTPEAVLEAHQSLAARDHFEILGLTPEATDAQVKAVYVHLVRRFHPDVHHEPGLAHLRAPIAAIFDRILTAYKVLSDPQSRARYESTLIVARLGSQSDVAPPPEPAPASAPTTSPSHEEALQQAEEGFGRGEYWVALQRSQEIAADTQGRIRQRARVLMARCYLKNEKWRSLAEEELKGVLREDPQQVDAYFLLGGLYKDVGLPSRAAAMFRKALELKPKHTAAAAELEALGAEESAKPGLLRKFFS